MYEDCNGRSGADVAHRACKALNILRKLSIYPGGYSGYTSKSSLYYWIGVADVIYDFRKIARKYPDYYFIME